MRTIVALLTDFGTSDWYVAAMKGVIKDINPKADIIDISHQIDPGNIKNAAFVLAGCYQNFPGNTVFCSVVDPGVGGKRKAIAVTDGNYFFVSPDNGLLSVVHDIAKKIWKARYIENNYYFLNDVSSTFHGRDIFAPVSAHISLGEKLSQFGGICRKIEILDLPNAEIKENQCILGEIQYFDHFGNLFTNIRNEDLEYLDFDPNQNELVLSIKNIQINGPNSAFCEKNIGQFLFYQGSYGYIEIAVNCGNALQRLDVKIGEKVKIYVYGNH
jgi:S-adenosylmethionine hydrolase